MEVQGLQLRVGADMSAATRSINLLQKQMERLQKIASMPNISFKQYERLQQMMGRTQSQMARFEKGMTGVSKSTFNAQQSMINFSRVVQDAPYGIMGVANNIDPLVQSLGGSAGLGIAVSVATTGLVVFGKQLASLLSPLNDAQKSVQRMYDAFAGGENEYTQAASLVSELAINIGLAKDGILKKEDVLRQYNETIGKTTGQVKSLDEAEQALTRNGDAYVKMMLYKAAANIALQEAAKKAFEAEQTRIKNLKEFESFGDRAGEGARNTVPDAPLDLDTQIDKQAKQNAQKRKQRLIDQADKAKTDFENIAKKFQTDAAEIASKFKFDFFDFDDKKGKGEKKEKLEINFFDRFFDFNPESTKLTDKQRAQLFDAIKSFNKEFGELFQTIDPASFKTEDAALKAAGKFWSDWQKGLVKLKPPKINIDFTAVPQINTPSFSKDFWEGQKEAFEKGAGANDLNLPPIDIVKYNVDRQAIIEKFKQLMPALKNQLPALEVNPKLQNNEEFKAQLDALYTKTLETAAAVSSVLAPAFTSMFDSIMAGQPALEGFFQSISNSIKQLIKQLIAAAAQAAILTLITGGTANFGKRFLGALKIPGFAGGTKKAPKGWKVVGEEGPELIYDGGGYPIFNNKESMDIMRGWNQPLSMPKLSSLSMPNIGGSISSMMQGLQNIVSPQAPQVNIYGNLETSMGKLKLSLAQEQRRQNRNF